MMRVATILWARSDRPGHEAARLQQRDAGYCLEGAAVFTHEAQSCRLDYRIVCDAGFQTRDAAVTGWIGSQSIDLAIAVDGAGTWRLNGVECAAVAGCIDLDLNFSPSTNLLPIRRLGLEVGAVATVRAAWLRFPSFTLEPLDQVYRRTGEWSYRYESNGGRFTADLEVDADGFVTHYPGFGRAV